MEPRRRQPEDRVAGADRRPVDDVGPLDDADAAAGQVEGVDLHQARVLGGLAADQRTAGIATAGRHRPDELGDPLGHDPADGDVVEEGERLGPAADDVVGAHRDEVDADRVEATERGGDRGLGPDPVGRGDQQRLAVAGRDARSRHRSRRARRRPRADGSNRRGRASGRRHAPRPRRRRRTRGTRPGPRRPPRPGHRTSPGTGSSSMNLRLAASYGTGSG